MAHARAAMLHACAIGCLAAALDLTIRSLHPGLAASRSALLGAMLLHALPFMLLALAWSSTRGDSGRVPAIFAPLAVLMIGGGMINILHLPGLSAPRSLLFDAAALLGCALAVVVLYRLPPAGRRARRVAAVIVCAALVTGIWARQGTGARPSAAKAARAAGPDLVVVLFDALRADRTSVYGHERDTTPNLRALAGESLVFERAYAPSSWTKPSVATLFTGVLPESHGNHRISSALPKSLPTLPELLRDAGYRCGVFAENSFVSPLFGYDRGADRIVANEPDVVAQTTIGHVLQQLAVRSAAFAPLLAAARRANVFDPRQRFKAHGGLDVIGASLDWLDDVDADERVFLYVHLMKPHAPYVAPSPYDGAFGAPDGDADDPALQPPHVGGLGPFASAAEVDSAIRERMLANYDERILYGDAMFGRLVEGLRARGRFDDAVVIVLADHGEEFGEHGLWDHGHSLQEGVIRIPLILRLPDGEGSSVRSVVRLYDVPSTLLAAAEVGRVDGIEGRDLRAYATSAQPDAPVLAQLRHGPGFEMDALVRGPDKLVHVQDGGREAWQLFDLSNDPREESDRAAWAAAELAALREELRLARELAGAFARGGHDVELDADTLEKLKALGYVE